MASPASDLREWIALLEREGELEGAVEGDVPSATRTMMSVGAIPPTCVAVGSRIPPAFTRAA